MIYFNNNSTSYPKPESVCLAVRHCLEEVPSSPYRDGICKENFVDVCRLKIARLFHVDEQEVVFTSGSTEALNLAIFGTLRFVRKSLLQRPIR